MRAGIGIRILALVELKELALDALHTNGLVLIRVLPNTNKCFAEQNVVFKRKVLRHDGVLVCCWEMQCVNNNEIMDYPALVRSASKTSDFLRK